MKEPLNIFSLKRNEGWHGHFKFVRMCGIVRSPYHLESLHIYLSFETGLSNVDVLFLKCINMNRRHIGMPAQHTELRLW